MSEPEHWFSDDVLDRKRWVSLVGPLLERVAVARQRDRYPQSLLLVGPQGLGRELAAVEVAAVLVCPEDRGPWCECRSCQRVRSGIHPDVAAVLPQGARGRIRIEQIREVVAAAPGRPYEAGVRVWILDGVEVGGLGREAANAFLKTLEEPPDHVRFLLLAANPAAVLATIRSRCQMLALPGDVASADRLGLKDVTPELVALSRGRDGLGEMVDEARRALAAGLDGRIDELLRLPLVMDSEVALQVVTAAALESIAEADDRTAEELVRLAGALVRAEQRTAALNLNVDRQLTACLVGWYRGLEGLKG